MAEYVKKDDVIAILRNLSHGTYNGIPVYSAEIDRAITDVYDLEPEDVVPVRHGRWIKGGYVCGENAYECSVCHETEWKPSASRMKYCMFCGAKMDGGGEDA